MKRLWLVLFILLWFTSIPWAQTTTTSVPSRFQAKRHKAHKAAHHKNPHKKRRHRAA
jgi:hypothetical protein